MCILFALLFYLTNYLIRELVAQLNCHNTPTYICTHMCISNYLTNQIKTLYLLNVYICMYVFVVRLRDFLYGRHIFTTLVC